MRFAITTTVAILALACTALFAGPALAHFPGEGVGEPELTVKARKLPSFLRIRAVFGTAPPEGCPITKPEDALTDEWDRYYSEFCASFRYQEADIVLTITRGKKNKVVYQESHAAREGSWDDRVYGYEITGARFGDWPKGRYRWTLQLADAYVRDGHNLTAKGTFRVK